MFKKIALTTILLGLFVAGSLIANEPLPTFNVEVQTHGFADVLEIGYIDYYGIPHYPLPTFYNVPSGIHPYSFFVSYGVEPPNVIFAEGWGPYGAHDYDECDAQLYDINHLELWLGVVPDPEEPEPPEE